MIEQSTVPELTTTMDSSGTVILPADVQTRLGLHDGARFIVKVVAGNVVLEPRRVLSLRELQDLLASDVDVVAELIEDRRKEKAREDESW